MEEKQTPTFAPLLLFSRPNQSTTLFNLTSHIAPSTTMIDSIEHLSDGK
jgi:hypothetical protein